MDDENEVRRALLRELENEIADLRAEHIRIGAKLARMEERRRDLLGRAAAATPAAAGAPVKAE
jgi:hypothetical protein